MGLADVPTWELLPHLSCLRQQILAADERVVFEEEKGTKRAFWKAHKIPQLRALFTRYLRGEREQADALAALLDGLRPSNPSEASWVSELLALLKEEAVAYNVALPDF